MTLEPYVLQIKLSPEERDRLISVAEAAYLPLSTWARSVLLQHIDEEAKAASAVPSSTLSSSALQPDVGSLWVHRSGGRICKVIGHRTTTDNGKRVPIVEFKYQRTAGGMGRSRTTPIQTMPLATWRELFTKQAPP